MFDCCQAVLLTSGIQTVVKCVGATRTASVTPSLVSAPATRTAGVRCASTPASAGAMASATRSMGTALAALAGGRRPAPNRASAAVGAPWASAVTS